MKRDIKSELLDLINSAGVRKMDKYSFGLLYKLSIKNNQYFTYRCKTGNGKYQKIRLYK